VETTRRRWLVASRDLGVGFTRLTPILDDGGVSVAGRAGYLEKQGLHPNPICFTYIETMDGTYGVE
jgi:hypothetical protein